MHAKTGRNSRKWNHIWNSWHMTQLAVFHALISVIAPTASATSQQRIGSDILYFHHTRTTLLCAHCSEECALRREVCASWANLCRAVGSFLIHCSAIRHSHCAASDWPKHSGLLGVACVLLLAAIDRYKQESSSSVKREQHLDDLRVSPSGTVVSPYLQTEKHFWSGHWRLNSDGSLWTLHLNK